ncbi:type 4a pilus biogenesis protein PilO [Solirubrobacter phytolaccae]|uniref:Type 4a pilus biogenesis protein PilO n=1 Tax=Solirubrobacter phytolaccae TaxID=1404360 RepID=A0A9X3NCJ2_9ACTN|nr:type 4a pilus biogenesis protein PilO [Solirubrobacter phytolaccae]MDA0181421.1 type 4a pilus biogenesis protein PilO [Solirubrobacter phytolaccae]
MSRTYKILLVLVVAVLAGGGYWKLALAPKRAQAAELEERVSVAEAQLAQQQALVNTYRGAQKDYKANYETVVRLGKAVPTDDDTRSLLVQLDTSAKRAGADFDAINVNGGGSTPVDGTTPAAPGAISAGAYSAMPFSFGFTGTFASLGDFFARLERFVSLKGDAIAVNGRLIRVESLTLAPAEDGWPGMQANIGASAYIVPETADPGAAGTTAAANTSTTTTTTTTTASAGDGSSGSEAR